MTGSNYFVGVYWAARHESAKTCAHRMGILLKFLAMCHPDLTQWFQQADSLDEALQRAFTPDPETLLRIIDNEESRNGLLGFTFGVWTGHTEEGHGAGVHVTCGSSIPDAPPNLCILSLPWPGTTSGEQILTRSSLKNIMRAMVLAWEPDWGVIVTDEVREDMMKTSPSFTHVGWLTYITRHWGEVPSLPGVFGIESIEDKGSLVILTEEPLGMTPEHLELGRRVQQRLASLGLLRGLKQPHESSTRGS